MSFEVDIGYASHRGQSEINEDFAAATVPDPVNEARGCIAAIADGVSSGGLGREAAQTTVMTLVQDYLSVPETWDTTVVLDRLIGAQNGWLHARNRRLSGSASMTTLTALALRGQTYTLAHVGDTRAYLLRDGLCLQLTQDHVVDHPDMRHRLTRAVGADERVMLDFSQGEMQVDDTFVLLSDGVHGVLKTKRIAELAASARPQSASEALVEAALKAGARDNVTALVVHVQGLSRATLADAMVRGCQLPIPPRLKVGEELDGFTVTGLVSDNGVHVLYQVRHNASRQLLALKTIHPSRASDPQERAMLAHEAWLASRVTGKGSSGLVGVFESEEPSAFYLIYEWHTGQTLEQMLDRGHQFAVQEVLDVGMGVCKTLGQLHRHGVVHRDIKPGNLHRGEDGKLRLLDLGAALSGSEPEAARLLHVGTPSYINPEQWDEEVADVQSDLFALGVTLYQLLTRRLPYGEIEPYQTARYRRDPIPPSRLRPDVPIWLDYVLLKAVARDKPQRFETAEEMLLALERGASRPLHAPGATPLLTRDPMAIWKIALAVSVLFNLLLIYWLLFLPR